MARGNPKVSLETASGTSRPSPREREKVLAREAPPILASRTVPEFRCAPRECTSRRPLFLPRAAFRRMTWKRGKLEVQREPVAGASDAAPTGSAVKRDGDSFIDLSRWVVSLILV